ncbi:DUF4439 domain-containing protein [uncultured Jatrophihabitans sp.]|uniref:DUF4439 domain-containing protein n=1 Tax=uncultured Jatrophihabitans sp. TaxID=1610747 RepID=UPI0035C95FFB
MSPTDGRLAAAWQAALAAEHQACFGYPLLGPHLDRPGQTLAAACEAAHQALRDTTEATLQAAALTPVAALADYPSLYPVPDAAAARRLAVRLEDACAQAWRYLYLRAASTADQRAAALRTTASHALTASAVRATRWRAALDPQHATQPFPGT